MAYISRAEWGALPSKRALSPWGSGQPSSWTMHYESTNQPIDQTRDYYSAVVRSVQRYHLYSAPDDYSDIAYNMLVSPIGDVYEGRGWDFKSGANGNSTANSLSFAICYLGGPTTAFTNKAQDATKWIFAQKPNIATVFPHSHWVATACPGQYIKDWINAGTPGGAACYCPPESDTPPPPPSSDDLAAIVRLICAVTKAALEDQDRRGVVLQYGSKGPDVRAWQDAMNLVANGNLTVDGDFGEKTRSVTRTFQSFYKLGVDGKVGPKTRKVAEYLLGIKAK